MNLFKRSVLVLVIALLSVDGASARSANPSKGQPTRAQAAPAVHDAMHDVGKMVLAVSNQGLFGIYNGGQLTTIDYCTGASSPACEFPKGSDTRYLYTAAFWIGAVVGRDTLVSTGADGWTPQANEFYPEEVGLGEPVCKSIKDPTNADAYEGAISEQDIIMVYTDTLHDGITYDADGLDGRGHVPLGIEVTQRSFAWSYEYAEDFVLFDYSIRNIGGSFLTDVYMGVYVDADVHPQAVDGGTGSGDDICGFVYDLPTPLDLSGGCEGFRDTVFIAWIADNDGDPNAETDQYEATSTTAVTATRIVRTPAEDTLAVSFNWWISNGDAAQDFGPQRVENRRLLGQGNLGTPVGDRSKYFLLKNGEFDYDQAFTLVQQQNSAGDTGWLPPGPLSAGFADGFDTRYLLSFGPFDLEPDQTLPISFAYIGGENFHSNPDNVDNLPNLPSSYYNGISFEDLGLNSTWASWIYDNPGVDSDGDGRKGDFRLCVQDSTVDSITYDTTQTEPEVIVDTNVWVTYLKADSIYYRGDGTPDFRGASPPPPPTVWLYPSVVEGIGEIRVRWNGWRSENEEDNFSGERDFEGYRVYISRDNRASSFSLVESYDRQDFNKFFYDYDRRPEPGYVLRQAPFTLQQIRDIYGGGDPDWDPLQYTPGDPLVIPTPFDTLPDSLIYFAQQDFNASTFGESTRIKKIYSDTLVNPRPPDSLLLWVQDGVPSSYPDSLKEKYFTEDGYLKYYEYEFTFGNLLPTVLYYVSVTTFDYGSPGKGLGSLESSVTFAPMSSYALPDADVVAAEDLKVYVYPNPYRIDGNYRNAGYEGRNDRDRPDERAREVHFANLPPECSIKIYTLDGDLVREIEHRGDANDPKASHEVWDMITRNTQAVVSGIYYWTVEAPGQETQIGKLIVIM